jgi:hypothetical protein
MPGQTSTLKTLLENEATCGERFPSGIACTEQGIVYFAESGWNRVAQFDLNQADYIKSCSVLCGKNKDTRGHQDGELKDALFHLPVALIHRDGKLYVGEQGSNTIRCVDLAKGARSIQ